MWEFIVFITLSWLVIAVLRLRGSRDIVESRFQSLSQRMATLEADLRALKTEVLDLRVRGVAAERTAPPATAVRADEAAPPPTPAAVPTPPIAAAPPKPVAPPAPVPTPPRQVTITPPAPPPLPISATMQVTAAPARVAPPAPPLPPPPPPKPAFSLRDLEEKFGANWLNKLGVIAMVIGVAFYLTYKLGQVGPAGKIAAAFALAFAMLGAGIFYEKRDRYRVLARAGIGGGWALTFFTTYAMHHVEVTRILESQLVDLILLFIIAVAMVVHTLRYDSQVVTGLAFLLAFATVSISGNTIYSLSAGAVLAVGLTMIVLSKQWFQLEIFGLLFTYINHFFWLRTIIEPMGGVKRPFPEFVPSVLLLVMFWAIFRWSYVRRRVDDDAQEGISTLSALLNSSLLLALMKYQSTTSGLAFYVLLGLGFIELALGQLPATRKRRSAFVVLSTIGATLVIAAIPFKFSGANTSILWLAEAQAFLLAGVFTREALFRGFGMAAAALTGANLLRITLLMPGPASLLNAATLGTTALVLYLDTQVIPRRWKNLVAQQWESLSYQALSYLAAALLFACVWVTGDWAKAPEWIGVGWAVAALLLAYIGWTQRLDDLSIQAHLFAMSAFTFALAANRDSTELYLGVTLRLLTFSMLAVILYVSSRWSGPRDNEQSSTFGMFYTTAGTACITILAYYELPEEWVAVAWIAFALVLNHLGRILGRLELTWQTHGLSAMSFAYALFLNLRLQTMYGRLSMRLITVGLIVIVLYALSRLACREDAAEKVMTRHGYSWAGSLLVVLLIWHELLPINVALGWGLFGVLLFELGMSRNSLSQRAQGYLAMFMAFGRIFFVNISAEGAPGAISPRLYTTLPLLLIFFYTYWRARRGDVEPTEQEERFRLADLLCYAGVIGVATLVRFELNLTWVVAGWAAMCLVLLGLAWHYSRPLYLHQAYLLSVAVAYRTVFHNFYERAHPYATMWDSRSAAVGTTIALLFFGLAFALPLRKRYAEEVPENAIARIIARPEQWFFFLPLALLVVLLALDVRSGMLTVAWGVLAIVVFLFALTVNQRSYRLAGLGLLLICIGKILLMDVWKLDPGDRYLTFIGLGAVMFAISYLYTRYKEKIRQYL